MIKSIVENQPLRNDYPGLFLFLSFLGLYLYTLFPTLAPYRDAGELTLATQTLGIAHPPGYPFYILIGKISQTIIPWGDPGYRLNIVSALAAAAAIVLACRFLRFYLSRGVAMLSAALFGCSASFWYLAHVGEMYTLNVSLFLLLAWILKIFTQYDRLVFRGLFLFVFIVGLSLTNRLDILLSFPFFLFLLGKERREIFHWIKRHYPSGVILLCFAVLGLSLYLYLLIRSQSQPWLDWANPETWSQLMANLTRKSYAHTLDLLSLEYKKGENFLPLLLAYFRHIKSAYTILGLPLMVLGMFFFYRTRGPRRGLLAGIIVGFCSSLVFFLYLANLPPNAHVLAILEPHYLLPDVLLLFLLAGGLEYIRNKGEWIFRGYRGMCLGIIFIGINLFTNLNQENKRENFFAQDYARNLFSGIKPQSILVLREDVQLFSSWYRQKAKNRRPDIILIAQGLTGSPWYEDLLQRQYGREIFLSRLRDRQNWQQFKERNSRFPYLYASGDCEMPANLPRPLSAGLAEYLFPSPDLAGEFSSQKDLTLINNLYIYRGRFHYFPYREFFTPDLLEEYANAFYRNGLSLLEKNDYLAADKSFLSAWAIKPDFPLPLFYRGYLALLQNDFVRADMFYQRAARAYRNFLNKAKSYRVLPEVIQGILREWGNVWLHRGVLAEKQGNLLSARDSYQRVLELNPASAAAYYNLGVLAWRNEDWGKAGEYFAKVVELEPDNQFARNYWEQAQQRAVNKFGSR